MNTVDAGTPGSAAPPRRRVALRVGVAMLLLALLGLACAAVVLLQALEAAPIQVTINGQALPQPLDLARLSVGEYAALVLALMAGLLAPLVVVPLVLVVVALAVALALLIGIGLPLLVVLSIAALAVAPLALLGWLVWRALRRSPTMPA